LAIKFNNRAQKSQTLLPTIIRMCQPQIQLCN